MNFWLIISLLAIGFSFGLFVGAKYINTPGNEFNLKKIKVRGQGNIVVPKINQNNIPEKKQRKGFLKKIFKNKNKNESTQ